MDIYCTCTLGGYTLCTRVLTKSFMLKVKGCIHVCIQLKLRIAGAEISLDTGTHNDVRKNLIPIYIHRYSPPTQGRNQ